MNLSSYFPPGTAYFCYHRNEDPEAFFYPFGVEDILYAQRILSITGTSVRPVVFDFPYREDTQHILRDTIGLPLENSIIPVGNGLLLKDTPRVRMQTIIADLRAADTHNLFVCHPFLDPVLSNHWIMDRDMVIALNDKRSMGRFFPAEYRPVQLLSCPGTEAPRLRSLPLPFVVKAAKEAGAAAVKVCLNSQDVESAIIFFVQTNVPIVTESFIEARSNITAYFGIPQKADQPIQVLPFTAQILGPHGNLGIARVPSTAIDEPLQPNLHLLLINEILPKFRAEGWFGVGSIDFLVDKEGHFYAIDANMRMSSEFPLIAHQTNGLIPVRSVRFFGHLEISPLTDLDYFCGRMNYKKDDRPMSIISLYYNGREAWFEGALHYTSSEELLSNIRLLQEWGVRSDLFSHPEVQALKTSR